MWLIYILNGPNLNLLGQREPGVYGQVTLQQIEDRLARLATESGHQLTTIQSNSESELLECIQGAPARKVDFIIFNPAGLTHTSVILRDALLAVSLPMLEVHLSNIHAREEFRRHSFFSDIAVGTISGLGAIGYELALQAAARHLSANPQPS